MLNEQEFEKAAALYSGAFINKGSLKERFKPLLDYYNELTGFGETNPQSIMHHRINQYGPICENCGKPYRTPMAGFCAACGNKRTGNL